MKIDDQIVLPNRWGTIRPRFIVSLVIILAFIGLIAGYIEISQGRKEVMALLGNEAKTLSNALSISAENAVLAYSEIEGYLEGQLYNLALLLNHLQDDGDLSKNDFKDLMLKNPSLKAFFVDREGQVRHYAYPESLVANFQSRTIGHFISPLFSSEIRRRSGYITDSEGHAYFTVALRRSENLAWIICADPAELTELRKRIGVGHLIQDFGKNDEIEYIVIQDERGILSATRGVKTISRLSRDPFLMQTLTEDTLQSRITEYQGENVFEVVKPLRRSGEILGLIRIGMSMRTSEQAMDRTIQQAIIVIFGFLVIGFILFNLLVSNQNYSLLTNAYSSMKTYTGNILESMADAVVAVNSEGRITLFNQAAEKLFNRKSGEAIGKSCHEIIGEQTSLLDETLRSKKEINDLEVEYMINGQKYVFYVTTRLLFNKSETVESVVAVIKDLTEKKYYEERLQRQEKLSAMGSLASGVAHEIRNPLNAISMIAQRFAYDFEAKKNNKEFKDLATSVISASGQVSKIIQSFLQFARPPEINLHKWILNDTVKKAITLVESQAMEKGVSLKSQNHEEIELYMDDGLMQQVFVNLLQNAIQATEPSGEIRIGISKSDNQATIKIEDAGIGISPQNIKKIFDLYFTTKDYGTGMGLSISHRIVSEHGGRIDVNSTVGKGTTFEIILPIKKSDKI